MLYLRTSKAKNGLLFNISDIYKVNFNSELYIYEKLVEPNQIIDFIEACVEKQNSEYEDEKRIFHKAQMGDFEAFKILALKYRRNKRIRFEINQGGSAVIIEGHLFEFEQNFFKYSSCSYDSKSENKPSCKMNEFVGLINIERY